MIWHKEIVTVTITAGTGAANTNALRGLISQMVILPLNSSGVLQTVAAWDLDIIDKDGDKLDSYSGYTGRLDNRTSLPVGRESNEKLTLSFANVSTAAATMRVFLKVMEKQ